MFVVSASSPFLSKINEKIFKIKKQELSKRHSPKGPRSSSRWWKGGDRTEVRGRVLLRGQE